MKELFKKIITDFIEFGLPELIPRELELPLESKKIISVIGARRTGKTSLLLNHIKRLRAKYPSNRIVYINFEDDRLFPLELKDLDNIIEAYFELFPSDKGEKIFFFFDEIQNVKNWEIFIRRIYDTLNCSIFITGSSSKLLSKEISTSLRGRSISYEVFPFSFKEFLSYKEIDVNFYSSRSRSKILHAFNQYLIDGSLPEIIELEASERGKSLKEYCDLVIYKDLVERYQIGNLHLMKYLVKFLFTNNATLSSFNKLYNDFKSLGLNVSRNSIYEYISYLEDSYSIYFTSIYSENIRIQNRNPKKVYLLDVGLKNVFTLKSDKGRNLENIVYLQLRRRNDQIYYLLEEKELDFYLPKEKEFRMINVCFDASDTLTKKREIESLSSFMDQYKENKALLLTYDKEEVISLGAKKIYLLPVWKWLLGFED